MEQKRPNALINEKSPYLQQHAFNPVNWYPWGEEAFALAKELDKPIFLSIGYSSCHWCHVMEKESFDNPEIAGLMNDAFVNIKVDREERPDIDAVYMAACQAMNNQGGWPLSIVMTPDKKPFFAATYIPPTQRYNRYGMNEFVPRIKEVWATRREEILASADSITAELSGAEQAEGNTSLPETEMFTRAFAQFTERFDGTFAGFGNAPKFPSPHNILFLIRYWFYSGKVDALDMAVKTLTAMRMGGMYDQIGFGFHRYSTDRQWLLPHFEKMLYDQAMLLYAYAEGYRATGNPLFRQTCEEIAQYLSLKMTSPEGLFYSAEDADSEGEEGKFYLWHANELYELLGEHAELFTEYWNISAEGNFADPIRGGIKTGENIPHLKMLPEDFAQQKNMPAKEFITLLEQARTKLYERREQRVYPFKDDKILTDWNGLMCGALAYAGFVLNNNTLMEMAERNINALTDLMLNDDGSLMHRARTGTAGIPGMLDDYAGVIFALTELFFATGKSGYLSRALMFTDYTLEMFKDEAGGGFFMSGKNNESLIIRTKEKYDGAIPSGNSLMLYNLVRLARITGARHLTDESYGLANTLAGTVSSYPSVYTFALAGYMHLLYPGREAVIALKGDTLSGDNFVQLLKQQYAPDIVHCFKLHRDKALNVFIPFIGEMEPGELLSAGYMCRNFSCSLPAYTLEAWKAELDGNGSTV